MSTGFGNGFGLMIESLVAVLLLLTIGFCVVLNSRLKKLKADEQALKATIEQKKMNTRILNVRDHAEALLTMETDRSDAYGSDDVLLYGARSRAKNPDQYIVVGEFLTYDPYAIMLPRNDSSFATLADKSIAKTFRDGSFMQTYKKWFDPIGMPLNPLLEAAIKVQSLPD